MEKIGGIYMVYERIREMIAQQLRISEDMIKPDSSFLDDLDADSLDIVELIMAIEEEFEIEFSEEEIEKIATVADAVNYINENK